MKNHLLVVGIIFLFLSSVVPMTAGINTDSEVDVELNRMLDNLKFMCMGPDGLIVEKYEYYKEQILSMYSSERLSRSSFLKPKSSAIPRNVSASGLLKRSCL